jgi:hypothetical protein
MNHLGGNDILVRRDMREKNISTIHVSRVTHDARNSLDKELLKCIYNLLNFQ